MAEKDSAHIPSLIAYGRLLCARKCLDNSPSLSLTPIEVFAARAKIMRKFFDKHLALNLDFQNLPIETRRQLTRQRTLALKRVTEFKKLLNKASAEHKDYEDHLKETKERSAKARRKLSDLNKKLKAAKKLHIIALRNSEQILTGRPLTPKDFRELFFTSVRALAEISAWADFFQKNGVPPEIAGSAPGIIESAISGKTRDLFKMPCSDPGKREIGRRLKTLRLAAGIIVERSRLSGDKKEILRKIDTAIDEITKLPAGNWWEQSHPVRVDLEEKFPPRKLAA